MSDDIREIAEGLQLQGANEVIAYRLTTTRWGSSPTVPAVKVYTIVGTAYTDVTTTVMPTGTPSVTGDMITWPALKLLTIGVDYFVLMEFTISGNVFSPWAIVRCRR